MLTHPPWRTSPLATNDILSNMEEDGRNFKLNPWLCALRFLGLGPNLAQPVPTCSKKARGSPAERLPQGYIWELGGRRGSWDWGNTVPLVVGARTKAIPDEVGRNLIYGEHVRIDGDSEERRHSVRLIAETISGEMSRNLSCERTNSLKTGLVGVLNKFSPTTSTTNMPVLGTRRDNMETEPGGTQRTLTQKERVDLSAEDITRSLPFNSIAKTAGLDRSSEFKNLISKDLLGQWTDEQ